MIDELVKKGLNAGYGEIVAGFVVLLTSVVSFYGVRQSKRYDKGHDALVG